MKVDISERKPSCENNVERCTYSLSKYIFCLQTSTFDSLRDDLLKNIHGFNSTLWRIWQENGFKYKEINIKQFIT